MQLISSSIPNLVNGVSQQTPSLRLASQSDAQTNCYPSVVEGLKKRPPTQHVAKIYDGQLNDAHIHTINRDINERYVSVITNTGIEIFDLDGNQKTVNAPDSYSYLDCLSPSTDIRSITIADYTFILNSTKETRMSADLSADHYTDVESMVYVKQGNYAQDYKIIIDDVVQATLTTSETAKDQIKTNYIAETLAAQLVTNLGVGWQIVVENYTIWIVNTYGNSYTIKTEDSFGGNALRSFKTKTQRFSDLPIIAPNDFEVEVIGDGSSNFDNYYVKFEADDASLIGKGVWVETIKPSIKHKIDPALMPHVLVRESDGTFTFRREIWGNRTVGDYNSAPDPSFIDSTISDIFFFKNRLGLLSDSNVILSEASEFFNFFPSTVTTIVDSAPIDVAAGHTKVSLLRHAVPFNESLLLFSDQTQFILTGGDILSQSTVSIDSTTEFDSSLNAKPLGVGNNIYFAVNKGKYSGVREYYLKDNGDGNDAADVTGHVPQYIAGNISKISAATNEDVILFNAAAEDNVVYVYKYYWGGNEKLQSAWGRWTFADDCKVINFDFIETDCYMVLQYSDGVYLERMSMESGHIDQYSDFYSDEGYVTHLDRRIDESQVVSASYSDTTGLTSFTMPFNPSNTVQVVTRPRSDGSGTAGVLKKVDSVVANVVNVRGDLTAEQLYIGEQYEQRYRFSVQVVKEPAPGGGQNVISSGRLQLVTWQISYANTGYFRAEVTPELRDTNVYSFTGRTTGAGTNLLGKVPVTHGEFRFPIMSRNDRVLIELVNDSFLPSNFVSAEYEARYSIRSKRL